MVRRAETGQQLVTLRLAVGMVILAQGEVGRRGGGIEGDTGDPCSIGINAKSDLSVDSSLLFEEGEQSDTSVIPE